MEKEMRLNSKVKFFELSRFYKPKETSPSKKMYAESKVKKVYELSCFIYC